MLLLCAQSRRTTVYLHLPSGSPSCLSQRELCTSHACMKAEGGENKLKKNLAANRTRNAMHCQASGGVSPFSWVRVSYPAPLPTQIWPIIYRYMSTWDSTSFCVFYFSRIYRLDVFKLDKTSIQPCLTLRTHLCVTLFWLFYPFQHCFRLHRHCNPNSNIIQSSTTTSVGTRALRLLIPCMTYLYRRAKWR